MNSWGYCSFLDDVDNYGNECQTDHPCGKYGYGYTWCKLKKGGWGKCSKGSVDETPILTANYKKEDKSTYYCKDACATRGSNYFWCHTFYGGWDYCSPRVGVTYRNELCRLDHNCGNYGKDYNWCYTASSWDYCGRYNEYGTWNNFALDSCSINRGKAIYSGILSTKYGSNYIDSMCRSFPATIGGQKMSRPLKCDLQNVYIVGQFEAIYDETIASSDKTCYTFEYEYSCDADNSGNQLRSRRQSKRQCDEIPQLPSYWRLYLLAVITQLINRNGQPQTRAGVPVPEPRVTRDFPGMEDKEVWNSFEFDGHHTFRLLRSDSYEDYRQQRNPRYERKLAEGNGSNGLSPVDPNSLASIYQHVADGQLRTRFISSTTDFGRTLDLAIEQALETYDEEASRNYGRGFSRWFVQINISNLRYYDLTDPIVFNRVCRAPNGGLPYRICRAARQWSEFLIEGDVPPENIVCKFEVYAVSSTEYVLMVHRNSNYQSGSG